MSSTSSATQAFVPLLLLIACMAFALNAFGDIQTHVLGPVDGLSQDAPGIAGMLASPDRVYSIKHLSQGHSNERYYFMADRESLESLLSKFDQADQPVHDVIVRAGAPLQYAGGEAFRYNVVLRRYDSSSWALTVFVDNAMSDWLGDLGVPDGITVRRADYGIDTLIARLRDGDTTAEWEMREMGTGGAGAVDTLLLFIRNTPSSTRQLNLMDAVAACGARLDDYDAVTKTLLEVATSDAASWNRAKALHVSYELGLANDRTHALASELIEGWTANLESPDEVVRSDAVAAIGALGNLGGEPTMVLLLRAMDDNSPDVRRRAVGGFRKRSATAEVRDTLLRAQQDSDRLVRFRAENIYVRLTTPQELIGPESEAKVKAFIRRYVDGGRE